MELSNELMCSFELESIVKFILHYSTAMDFRKFMELIYFSLFTISMNFLHQLVTNICEPVLKD